MSRLPVLPTLFGRATAVLGEHPTLHRTLDRLTELRDVLGGDEAPPIVERVRIIDELTARMRAHFEAEETEYFATLVSACPGFRSRVSRLTREHDEFLRAVEWLRDAFEQDAEHEEVGARLSSFIDSFTRHEADETMLLHEFLIREDAAAED